jgi:hypothetical protein
MPFYLQQQGEYCAIVTARYEAALVPPRFLLKGPMSATTRRRNMTMRKTSLALLLLSACWIMPAAADTAEQRIAEAARVHDTIIAAHLGGTTNVALGDWSGMLEGQTVVGAQGESLGSIIAVDQESELAQLHMYDMGKSIALPIELLSVENRRVMAPTVSHSDVVAMTRTQSGDSLYGNRVMAAMTGALPTTMLAASSPVSGENSYTYQMALSE